MYNLSQAPFCMLCADASLPRFEWRKWRSSYSYKDTANKFAVLEREMCLSKL